MSVCKVVCHYFMNGVDVSVVIPVKDGERYLDSALKAIFSQKGNFKFEVIIIDSGSKDKTLDIINKYPVNLCQVKEQDFNHGLTRNYGISMAKGEYIILMTQDALPYNEYWMEGLVNSLRNDELVAGVYSRQVPRDDAHPLIRHRIDKLFSSERKEKDSYIHDIKEYNGLSGLEKYLFCRFDNVSSCIRKDVWEKVPFPETDFAEDLEWSKSILEAGYKIVYEPKSIVVHSHNGSIYNEYSRAFICYKKLYKLFRLQPVPSIIHALYFSLKDTISGIRCTVEYKGALFKKLLWLLEVPFICFFALYGQYNGARRQKAELEKFGPDLVS